VIWSDGPLLSGRIVASSLREALDELGRVAHAEIVWRTAPSDEPISVEFRRLSVERAVERLLRGHDHTVRFEPAEQDHNLSRIAIELLSSGTAGSTQASAVHSDAGASTSHAPAAPPFAPPAPAAPQSALSQGVPMEVSIDQLDPRIAGELDRMLGGTIDELRGNSARRHVSHATNDDETGVAGYRELSGAALERLAGKHASVSISADAPSADLPSMPPEDVD
jgi:hypothetical protein